MNRTEKIVKKEVSDPEKLVKDNKSPSGPKSSRFWVSPEVVKSENEPFVLIKNA